MSASKVIIKKIFDAISQDDQSTLKDYIERVPLDQLGPIDFDNVLQQFLAQCGLHNRSECAKIIMQRFEEGNASEDTIPLFTYLFTLYLYTDELLGFLVKVFDETTYYEHMTNLIEYDEAPMIPAAAYRLTKIYQQHDLSVFDDLLAVAESQNNNTMQDFISEQIKELSPSAPKPSWVKNFTNQEELPFADEIIIPEPTEPVFAIPSLDTVLNVLTEGLENQGVQLDEVDDTKRFLASLLAVSPQQDIREILEPVMTNRSRERLDTDAELYRILGPVSATYDSELTIDHVCCKYGGCRMFTCVEFESADVEDDSYDPDAEWFTGNCDYCFLKIDNKYWSVRQPLPNGGWKGCYDSWNCVRKDIAEQGPNMLVQAMINRVEGEINRIGIQDRRIRPSETAARKIAERILGTTFPAEEAVNVVAENMATTLALTMLEQPGTPAVEALPPAIRELTHAEEEADKVLLAPTGLREDATEPIERFPRQYQQEQEEDDVEYVED